MTWAEARVWWRLRDRGLGVRFRRQEPMGPYIADFVCREKRLLVEIDGNSHTNHVKDEIREAAFERNGYRVLRFTDQDVVADIEGVIDTIAHHVKVTETPSPGSPSGEPSPPA